MKILVSKREDLITISCNGNKLIIDKNNKLFELLISKTKDEIKIWYETDRFDNLLGLNN